MYAIFRRTFEIHPKSKSLKRTRVDFLVFILLLFLQTQHVEQNIITKICPPSKTKWHETTECISVSPKQHNVLNKDSLIHFEREICVYALGLIFQFIKFYWCFPGIQDQHRMKWSAVTITTTNFLRLPFPPFVSSLHLINFLFYIFIYLLQKRRIFFYKDSFKGLVLCGYEIRK